MLRTDGGGEYKSVDLFCRDAGVARQIKESGNQAVNGKAERMYRTVMNMVRYMTVRVICLFLFESMQQNILFTV